MKKLFLIAVIGIFAIAANAQTTTPPQTTTPKATTTPAKSTTTMQKMPDGVMMENGKMMAMKDNKEMPMTKEMKMKNGTTVMTDGSYTTKDGKKMTLKNGDCMDMNGHVKSWGMDKMKSQDQSMPKK